MAKRTSITRVTSLQAGYGNTRVIALLAACFILGAGTSAVVYYLKSKNGVASTKPPQRLTETTTQALSSLRQPVEIRFYSLLDSDDVPEPTRKYAERVSLFLGEYERYAPGKITVTRRSSGSEAAAEAAAADGILGFNREKGDVAYLGIVASAGGEKEILSQLRPEWEMVLEADVTRAITKVAARSEAAARPPSYSKEEGDAQAVVKQVFTNLSSVSTEEGTQHLRTSAVEEFKRAVADMQVALRAAEQNLVNARQSGSAEEQAAAQQSLVSLQAEHTRRLQEIAAKSSAELKAFEQLKAQTK